MQALSCPWCGTANRELDRTNCVNCGGPLPHLPSANLPEGTDVDDILGPPPPPAPRQLPAQFEAYLSKNRDLFTWKHLALAFFLCWTCVMPFMVMAFAIWLPMDKRRILRALRHGVPVRGTLVEVRHPITDKIGGTGDRTRLGFSFRNADGVQQRGRVLVSNPVAREYAVGEPVWVVQVPGKPSVSTLWPPLY